jgi:hypothetical protein
MRRVLMLVRNAPPVVPSADFSMRLAARLATERALPPTARAEGRWRRRVTASAIALGLTVVGGITILASPSAAPATVLSMAPIVVRPPTIPAEPVAAPAMFATVSSSLPVYPAVLLAQRATEHFAAVHARAVTFQAGR